MGLLEADLLRRDDAQLDPAPVRDKGGDANNQNQKNQRYLKMMITSRTLLHSSVFFLFAPDVTSNFLPFKGPPGRAAPVQWPEMYVMHTHWPLY